MSGVGWVIAVGGPLLGIGAVVALTIAHEHSRSLRRLPIRLPSAPQVVWRARTTLFEDYLAEERQAAPSERRRSHDRLLVQVARASTTVLEEFLEERAGEGQALPVAAPPVVRVPARPVLVERSARPTRLVPLRTEIAIN